MPPAAGYFFLASSIFILTHPKKSVSYKEADATGCYSWHAMALCQLTLYQEIPVKSPNPTTRPFRHPQKQT
jgi:hypothetical protein